MKRAMLGLLLLGLVVGGGYIAYTLWKAPQRYFESGKRYFD